MERRMCQGLAGTRTVARRGEHSHILDDPLQVFMFSCCALPQLYFYQFESGLDQSLLFIAMPACWACACVDPHMCMLATIEW